MEKNIFAGTFLADLPEILKSKDFQPGNLKPIKKGEEVVGEMTDLEKAIDTLLETISETMAVKLYALKLKGTCGCTSETISPECTEISALKGQCEVLNNIKWLIINDRYPKISGLAIRQGWKIVKRTEEDLKNDDAWARSGSLGTILMGGN